MKRISFSLTKPQFLNGTKTVTRRLGWKSLKAGEHLLAVEKAMGLRKGEKQVVLGEIRVVDARQEPLNVIPLYDCAREGFPEMTPAEFVEMFCRHMRCKPTDLVTRIEFTRVSYQTHAIVTEVVNT